MGISAKELEKVKIALVQCDNEDTSYPEDGNIHIFYHR
jgi:hypothetical protein